MRIGICGAGTVAQGVVQILRDQSGLTSRLNPDPIEVVALASRRNLNLPVFKGIPFIDDVFALAEREDVDVLVELIGGTDDAFTLVKAALANGKSVVTANKALLAHHGAALFQIAREHGASLLFEAAVCGGIPIIKALNESFVGNRVKGIAGIINGTTNFILTKMAQQGQNGAFDAVLAEAQRLGYAEADPTFDIGGMDAAHKLAIMASLAFDEPLQIGAIYVEGIESVTSDDHEWAERLGFSIKHLGIALADDGGIEMRVHPALVPNGSQLASIQDVTNAVNVLADPLGEILLTGAGAGAGPTGSSVVSDLFDLAAGCARKPPPALMSVTSTRAAKPIEHTMSGWMIRVDVPDESGAMSEVASVLAEYGLSIDQIRQRDTAGGMATVALILDPVREDQLRSALSNLEGRSNVAGTRAIRVFDPRTVG